MRELGLRDKDIGLAAVVEGGVWIEKETTSLGGSARVSFWLRGWHHGGRGVPSGLWLRRRYRIQHGCRLHSRNAGPCHCSGNIQRGVAVKNGRHIETMRQAYQKEHPLRRRPPTRFQKGWLQVDPQVSSSVAFPHS
jgi:hypothetical protein